MLRALVRAKLQVRQPFTVGHIMSSAHNCGTDFEVPENFEKIVEGQAHMLYEKSEAVFYNKVQVRILYLSRYFLCNVCKVLNRDLSIQVIRLFAEERNSTPQRGKSAEEAAKGIRILDALAATGLRSVRYLKEIPGTIIMVMVYW